jgi:F-type H+-transporting ATPase subunit b
MKRRSFLFPLWTACALSLVFTAAIWCAEEGATPAEESPVGTVFKWLHFLIVAGAMYWLVVKVLPPIIRRNADKITAAIIKATSAKNEAERRLKEAAVKLTSLEHEIAQFREQAQKDAAAELERLRSVSKAELEKVRIAAKAEIEAAERAARVELKAIAAKLAVDRAESLVAKEMTPALHSAMIENFVHTLEGRPN